MCNYFCQCLELREEDLENREVDVVDIVYDEINPKHYKEEEVSERILL